MEAIQNFLQKPVHYFEAESEMFSFLSAFPVFHGDSGCLFYHIPAYRNIIVLGNDYYVFVPALYREAILIVV